MFSIQSVRSMAGCLGDMTVFLIDYPKSLVPGVVVMILIQGGSGVSL